LSFSLLAIIGWGAGNGSLTMFIQTKWNEHTYRHTHIETQNALYCVRVDYLAHDSFTHTMTTIKKNLYIREKKKRKEDEYDRKRFVF
jgi:hypothetical protein